MVKSYYLTYAIKAQAADLDGIGQRIGKLLAMQVVPRTSSYVGDYVTCERPAADRLSITLRNRRHFPPETDYKQYGLELFAQNTTGKNVDKEQRHKQLKQRLAKLSGLLLLEERVEEVNN